MAVLYNTGNFVLYYNFESCIEGYWHTQGAIPLTHNDAVPLSELNSQGHPEPIQGSQCAECLTSRAFHHLVLTSVTLGSNPTYGKMWESLSLFPDRIIAIEKDVKNPRSFDFYKDITTIMVTLILN